MRTLIIAALAAFTLGAHAVQISAIYPADPWQTVVVIDGASVVGTNQVQASVPDMDATAWVSSNGSDIYLDLVAQRHAWTRWSANGFWAWGTYYSDVNWGPPLAQVIRTGPDQFTFRYGPAYVPDGGGSAGFIAGGVLCLAAMRRLLF